MQRKVRLIASLAVAMVLTTVMVYTALAGEIEVPHVGPAQLLAGDGIERDATVQLEGVARGPVEGEGSDDMRFTIKDRDADAEVAVRYSGSVPDAFKVGRDVLVKGALDGDEFVAEPGSLVTKCPSKFQGEGDKA
jgi:cytochrome c-type biogenesis protein CcmE